MIFYLGIQKVPIIEELMRINFIVLIACVTILSPMTKNSHFSASR